MDEQNKPEKSMIEKLAVPIAIVIAGVIIGGALYYSNLRVKSSGLAQQVEAVKKLDNGSADLMRPISSEDHILGNPNADVIIVEYSDTECPFCKQFHVTLKRVMSEYGKNGKVAWVYRHFPIDSLHKKARKEAEATECANELGGTEKFWQYTDLLYATTNSNDSLDPAELPKIAKTVGLDVKAFNSCLSSGRYKDKVQKDYEDAIKIGGKGTPTSILITKDGVKTPLEGAQPYENVKAVLDAMLN